MMFDNIWEQIKRIPHRFHVPVMGTAFTVDAPLKVAKFGISSVISIGDDELCEIMRKFYAQKEGFLFEPISKERIDYRSKRISAYLNLIQDILDRQIEDMKAGDFETHQALNQYFDMLPKENALHQEYLAMKAMPTGPQKLEIGQRLKQCIVPGFIDVNIMTKIDRDNYSKEGELLGPQYSDALSALRGFAESKISSNVIFSAGFNRRLYAHCEQFPDFFPDESGRIKKGIILKVSDFRSSQIQGKFLAKKGLWVAEHRIESGLNCGGHAFATAGYLIGPIMQEFLDHKKDLFQSLFEICNQSLLDQGKLPFPIMPYSRVTMQGGIGTSEEQSFLYNRYQLDGTGWASPFLLVPEVTTLDMHTRDLLAKAKAEDFYLSGNSPLGVPFNTVKGTDSEIQRMDRYRSGNPGSPCPKGHLISNTEFSKKPVCTASIFYQKRKLAQIDTEAAIAGLSDEAREEKRMKVVIKTCLCEDLASSALLVTHSDFPSGKPRPLKPTVCPGPNLANFSKLVSLKDMVAHIYGKLNLMTNPDRSHCFISELKMYIQYLENELKERLPNLAEKDRQYLGEFRDNLNTGIRYYQGLFKSFNQDIREKAEQELAQLTDRLNQLIESHQYVFG